MHLIIIYMQAILQVAALAATAAANTKSEMQSDASTLKAGLVAMYTDCLVTVDDLEMLYKVEGVD